MAIAILLNATVFAGNVGPAVLVPVRIQRWYGKGDIRLQGLRTKNPALWGLQLRGLKK